MRCNAVVPHTPMVVPPKGYVPGPAFNAFHEALVNQMHVLNVAHPPKAKAKAAAATKGKGKSGSSGGGGWQGPKAQGGRGRGGKGKGRGKAEAKAAAVVVLDNEGHEVRLTAKEKKAQAKAAAEAENAAEIDAMCDEGTDDPDFVIHGHAYLLTYATAHIPLEALQALPVWESVWHWSMCHETGAQLHTHVYIQCSFQQNLPLNNWSVPAFSSDGEPMLDDEGNRVIYRPNCQVCSARGRSYIRSADRGHFYVVCIFKNTHVWSDTNYPPLVGYTVDTAWLATMWRQSKIDSARMEDAMSAYRCATKHLEFCVRMALAYTSTQVRMSWKLSRTKEIASNRQPFRECKAFTEWMRLHKLVRERYPFLWIVGDSLLGKTQWARAQFRNPFVHFGGVNWTSYDALIHDAIIFDDCSCADRSMDSIVMGMKQVFQASLQLADVNNSNTNCYARRVDVAAKPMIVLSNGEQRPHSDWVLANCDYIEFTSMAYGQPVENWWNWVGMVREPLPDEPVENLVPPGQASGSGSGNQPALEPADGGGVTLGPNLWRGTPAVPPQPAIAETPDPPSPGVDEAPPEEEAT